MSPFDNYLKFQVYTYQSNKPTPLDLNINATIYRAVFETESGKIKIDNLNDETKENLSNGEIIFNIPASSSEEILQSSNRNFYITSVAQDGTETLIYNGEWRNPSEQNDVDIAIANVKEEADNQIETKLTEIDIKLDKLSLAKTVKNVNLFKRNFKIDIPGFVKKYAKNGSSTVNRFGMKWPTSIKTNRKDA
jgi:hypothetical protein